MSMLNNQNPISAEMQFEKAKKILYNSMLDQFMGKPQFTNPTEDCWKWVNERKLSQSEVRLETSLAANTTNFTFAVTDQQKNSANQQFNTERRLDMQDSLVASEYGIFVAKTTGVNDDNFDLRTYGNTVDFTAAAAAAIDKQLFTNGSFSISANKDTVYPYRGLFNHLYRPQTQQTAALGAGSPGDQICGANDGMITLQPNIWLIGSKGYIPQVTIRNALGTVDANSRIIVIFRGVLAQNSTSVS